MSQVIVRNLDQQTVSALKSRAAAHGRSLEQELRLVLATAAKPSRQELLEIADAIRSLRHQAGLVGSRRADPRRARSVTMSELGGGNR